MKDREPDQVDYAREAFCDLHPRDKIMLDRCVGVLYIKLRHRCAGVNMDDIFALLWAIGRRINEVELQEAPHGGETNNAVCKTDA